MAVPRPLHGGLDYRPPPGPLPAEPVGCRVAVPLGRGRAVGVVVATRHGSEVAGERLRDAQSWLDEAPLLSAELVRTLGWAARYYRYPLGAAIAAALPGGLRQGRPARRAVAWWRLDAALAEDDTPVRRSPRDRKSVV